MAVRSAMSHLTTFRAAWLEVGNRPSHRIWQPCRINGRSLRQDLHAFQGANLAALWQLDRGTLDGDVKCQEPISSW